MLSWHSISKKIVEKSGIDWIGNEKEKDLCVYSFEILLSNCFNFALIIAFCFYFDIVKESLLFIFFYCPVRFFAGGGHAPNHISCVVIFYLYMHGSIVLSQCLLQQFSDKLLLLCMVFLFLFCCYVNYKYACYHKPEKQKTRHRKRTAILFLIDAIILLYCFDQKMNAPIILASLGFTLESIMLLPLFYKPPVYKVESMRL